VIAVSGLGLDGKAWKGSLIGQETVLAAPASNLMGAKPNGYEWVQGTSFAAPLVSASAALVRSRYPQMSAANVVQRLIMTARDAGLPGRDSRYGFGIVDPVAALTRSNVPVVDANPLDTTPPPGDAAFGPAATQESVPFRTNLPPEVGERRDTVPPSPSLRPLSQARAAQAPAPPARGSMIGLAAAIGAVALIAAGVAFVLRRL
jgi:subtilisin family serine protease